MAGLFLALASCQRTAYTAFQKPTVPVTERIEPTNPSTTSVQAREGGISAPVVGIPPARARAAGALLLQTPTHPPSQANTTAETTKKAVAPRSAAPAPKLLTPLVARRIEKLRNPRTAQAQGTDKSGETMSLLATIFGGLGFLMVWQAIAASLGLLLAIAGLVLGIVSLRRVPRTKKVLSILGIVFGGLVVLIYLYAFALFGLYF